MKKLVTALLVLVAAGAAAGLWYAGRQAPHYRLSKIERGPISAVLATTGTVNAASTVQVGSRVSGEIKEIYADFNSRVKKGDVLARLDATPFELKVSLAREEVENAREQRRSPAALKQREALLNQAEEALERTYIRAPVDGTVVLRNADAGQAVAGGEQAPALFSIARDLHEVLILAAVGDAEGPRLAPGMPAAFTVDAFPRRRFGGEVREIRKSRDAKSENGATVLIAVPNPDLALLPGMTAHVRITLASRAGVLEAPNAALRWRPTNAAPEATPRVWILEDGEPRPVAVRLGLTDGTRTELVQSPLAEGTRVIVGTAP